MKKLIYLLLTMVCCMSCSDEGTPITEANPQQVLNEMKGDYTGYVLIDNIPNKVGISIGDRFTVSDLPLQPILRRIFPDAAELAEALASQPTAIFHADTDNMTVSVQSIQLKMQPAELNFTVRTNGTEHQVLCMVSSAAYTLLGVQGLSVYLELTELLCDGKSYDLTSNKITYFMEEAAKVQHR